MKRIEIVDIPAQKASTKQVTIYCCDLCEYESEDRRLFRTCCVCNRLVCSTLTRRCGHSDPYETGDYPDHYCKICYDLKYKKYDQDFSDIELNYEEEIEALTEKVREESLQHES